MKNKLKILSILFLLLAGSITLTSCGDDDDDSSSSSFTLKGSGS
jgi:ABC-type oligopeptide transport system substrate-binding subunit